MEQPGLAAPFFVLFLRMRWFKYALLAAIAVLGLYTLAMYYFVDESKVYRVEKEVDFPVDKVYPQFSSLQNFARWNVYFTEPEKLAVQFYEPYEGKDAAMSFSDKDGSRKGDLFLRYVNPNSTLKYQLFEGNGEHPSLINVRLSPTGNRTKITWFVHTPKKRLLLRSSNLFSATDFTKYIDASTQKLANVLGNKVDRSTQLASVKFDSLMVEEVAAHLLLGVNVSTSNRQDALFKNIVLNHNKVNNYVMVDLGKEEDEFGMPVLITDAANYKDKEVSYYYGVAVPKRVAVADNNFTFRTLNPGRQLVMYYKGRYEGRSRAIQQLLQKAGKDSLRHGELQQTFMEPPVVGKDVTLKLALPVFR